MRENLFINPVTAGAKLLKPMNPGGEHARALRVLHRYSVRPPEPERIIATLSGGNQQKVIVARWMEAGSRLLVLEEPTFGVDVGSKAEIYQLLQKALDEGLAVLLISSDFEEVAGICHRALIFDRGSVTAELQSRRAVDRAADGARFGRRREEDRSEAWMSIPYDSSARIVQDERRAFLLGLEPGDPARPADPRLLAAQAATPSSPPSPSSRW